MGTRLCGGVSTAAAAGMDERGRSIAGRVDTSTRSGGAPSSSISAAMLGEGESIQAGVLAATMRGTENDDVPRRDGLGLRALRSCAAIFIFCLSPVLRHPSPPLFALSCCHGRCGRLSVQFSALAQPAALHRGPNRAQVAVGRRIVWQGRGSVAGDDPS